MERVAAVEQLRENGYVVLPGIFPEATLEPIRELTQAIIHYGDLELEDPFGRYYLRHRTDQGVLYDLYFRHPEFRALAQEPRILDVLAGAVGEDIFLYENSLVYKPKGKDNEVPWHQDFMNRTDEPTKYIIWVALDDVTVGNGALKFIPGTHKLGFMPWYRVPGETHHTRLKLDGVDTENFQFGEMKAGDVLIFHHLVIHGSDRVAAEEPRRAYRFAVQGFDQIFTPRATPIVLRGGRPDSLAKRYPAKFDPSTGQKGLLRRVAHKVGRKLTEL